MRSIAEIREQRAGLVAQAALQRARLAESCLELQGPAAIAERGIGVIAWLGRRPIVVGIATVLLVALRPRGALKLAGQGLVAWRTLRTIRGFLKEAGVTL